MIKPWHNEPSALDEMAEFKKIYMRLVNKRMGELSKVIGGHLGEYSEESAIALEEIGELRFAEQRLHRLIHTFVAEAVKPMQDALVMAMDRNLMPPTMFGKARSDNAITSGI